jgi:hypothetical protein
MTPSLPAPEQPQYTLGSHLRPLGDLGPFRFASVTKTNFNLFAFDFPYGNQNKSPTATKF